MQITPAVLVQQADGRLLAGGPVNEGRLVQDPFSIVSVDWLAFARFNHDGSVDESFGHAGFVEEQFDGWQFAPPFFDAWAALPGGISSRSTRATRGLRPARNQGPGGLTASPPTGHSTAGSGKTGRCASGRPRSRTSPICWLRPTAVW
jgi:hypothetical protein